MKKIIIALLAALFISAPINVFAETQAKDLKETVESIGLTFKGTDYKETDDQVVVYVFRWNSCDHCHDLITFLNDKVEEYGDKFKVRSFETSANIDNENLQKRVANFLKIKAPGVPLVIIGESSFYGFKEEYEEKILKAIDDNYELEDRYDVFDEMEKHTDEKVGNASTIMIVFIGVVIVILIGFTVVIIKKK